MDSIEELWALVCEYLKAKIGETLFNIWIKPIEILSFDGSVIELTAGEMVKKIVAQRFDADLKEAFNQNLGFDVEYRFVDKTVTEVKSEQNILNTEEEQNTFDTFVVGSSNRFAFAAAKAVAEKPVYTYNPLFIWGSSGLGKTHLLCAIRHAMTENNPNINVVLTRGEDFVNLIIDGINTKSMNKVHDKFRGCDVLLVDDIQFIAGKAATQEEFFHTFNALTADKKQIVLTSDRPPKDIEILEDRLRSRFESGLTVDIQAPDFETRMAIISRKARALNVDLPNDVVRYLAEKVKDNIRQLEGAVKKIHALVNLEGSQINVAMAQSAIKDMANDGIPVDIMVNKIITETSRTYGVSQADISSKKRDAKTVKARQVAMYCIRQATELTQQDISNYFNCKDRTTVIYSLKQIGGLVSSDSSLKRTVDNIIKNAQEQQ